MAEKSRRTFRADLAKGLLTMQSRGSPEVVGFLMADLPASALNELAMEGAISVIRRAPDPVARWAELEAGKAPSRRSGPAAAGPSLWQRATAMVMLSEATAAGVPMTEQEALAAVLAMGREKAAQARSNPAVIRQHDKLSRKAGRPVPPSLLALAGISKVEQADQEDAA